MRFSEPMYSKKAKVIEYYEKFLDLWKDADPAIAEVEDMRKNAFGLKIQFTLLGM